MRFGSALGVSGHRGELDAGSLVERAAAGLDGDPACAMLFAADGGEMPEAAPAALRARFPGLPIFGCSASGVAGGGREVEHGACRSVLLSTLPLRFMHLGERELATLIASPLRAAASLGLGAATGAVLLPDPFTVDVERLLPALDAALSGAPILGGVPSGAQHAGDVVLWDGVGSRRAGAVLALIDAPYRLDPIVAQGCRPIGEALTITSCEGAVIRALDGQPPLQALRELHERLPDEDKDLARRALLAGLLPDESVERPQAGDWLIRNVMGLDPKTGAIAVGARMEAGQRLQFHVRDARTAAGDLRAQLARARGNAEAALLFSCVGRGEGLYHEPDHDSREIRARLGADLPIAGFFCAGEIGPVGGATWMHGFTAAIGAVREG